MLNTKKVTNNSEDRLQVMELYEEAFPPYERMPFDLMLELNEIENVDLCSVYDDNEFIGFYLMIRSNNLAYVSFLAIVPEKRSQGYGSRVLNFIKASYPGYEILLDEEPVREGSENYEQRLARKHFYEKNGFSSTHYLISAYGQDYEILSTGDDFDISDYLNIFYSIGFTGFKPEVKVTE
ncbi:MAG: GNAT family N-acetyltransferase [Erysipelotrichaceae bacterium]|nr:GNAT family N-acetyltransferase [Erysipelotrichaceae bacterium]